MKLRYNINNISGKNKALCIGDLIRYYGETKYTIIEKVNKLNSSENTKGMVTNLLKRAMDNPQVGMVMDNLEELAKKDVFKFTVDEINLCNKFDNDNDNCSIVIDMRDEYFTAKAIYAMMRPGFRKQSFEDFVNKEKQDFKRWFEKNLKEYTSDYNCVVVEE